MRSARRTFFSRFATLRRAGQVTAQRTHRDKQTARFQFGHELLIAPTFGVHVQQRVSHRSEHVGGFFSALRRLFLAQFFQLFFERWIIHTRSNLVVVDAFGHGIKFGFVERSLNDFSCKWKPLKDEPRFEQVFAQVERQIVGLRLGQVRSAF